MADYSDLIPSAVSIETSNYADLIPKPAVAPPTEDLTKPAFLTPRQPATTLKKVQEAAVAERAEPKYAYKDLYKNDDLYNIIKDYSKVAMNKEPAPDQSRQAFVNDFMSKMRGVEFNAILDTVPELNKLRNASPEDAVKMALAYKVYGKTASALSAEGQPGIRPYWDALKAIATDPSNYVGFGVGAAGKKVVVGAAKAEALKAVAGVAGEAAVASKLSQIATKAIAPTAGKVAAAGTIAESSIAVGQNVMSQKLGQQTAKVLGEEVPELDNTQLAVAALFGAVGGFAEARSVMKAAPGKSGAEQLQELIQSKNIVPKDPLAPVTKVERTLLDPVTENMDQLVDEFNKTQGQKILDEISPITPLAEAGIQRDLSARAIRVAMHIIDQDPAFRLKPNQKTSSAINEVFANLDKGEISDALLEQAIRKEGLTPQEFAQANKMTVTQAAQVMQQYSAASRLLGKLTQIDPDAKKIVDSLFAKPDDVPTAMGFVGNAIQKVERESKAWMVSGVATTVRNIIGTSVGLTYNSAASLIEGSLYTIGKTLSGASTGMRVDTFKRGMGDTIKDTFNVYGLLYKQGLAEAATDTMLKYNPSINNALFTATQEGSTKEISKVAQLFNTLNVVQDSFFRKAIFTASVDKHMRRAGLDMYQTIGEGKVIPADILKRATDDALKATFSYMPKQTKEAGFEAGSESAANLIVKGMEYPGLSLVAPFARFMSNAIAFQYRYSVFGAASGAQDILQGGLLKSAGKDGGDYLVRQGTENLSKGIVGTAVLAYAYDYRLKNQDSEWFNYKQDDGSTTDLRALFPAGPVLAVADFMAKRKLGLEPKTAEMAEAIIGMKMPAGTQNTLLDQVFSAFSSEKDADKLDVMIGKVLGDFTTRFTQPFIVKNAYDFLDLFREEGSVQRDPNVIVSDDKITEAAMNRIQKRIPIAKEYLPAYQPYLRQGPVYQEGEFFANLIGVRQVPEKSVQEREIVRLGIEPYKFYGGATGDKQYDRKFVELANPMVSKFIDRAMASERYKALPLPEQKLALANTVKSATEIARSKTEAVFTSSDINKIYKMKFDKLTAEKRRVINDRYAKDHEGKSLEEAKDFKAVYKYEAMLGNLQFALGGIVAKGAKAAVKSVSKVAATAVDTSVNKAIKDVDIDAIVNKAIDEAVGTTTIPVVDQMSKVLAKTPVAAKKPVAPPSLEAATPVPAPATKAPVDLLQQTGEALPPPLPKKDVLDTLYDDIYEIYPNNPTTTTKRPFPQAAYVKGKADLISDFGAKEVENMIKNDPKDYANMLHVYAGDTLGLKKDKGLPPLPYEVADTAIVKYDDMGNPIPVGQIEKKTAGRVVPEQEVQYSGEYLTGVLGKDLRTASMAKRNEVLSEIKDARKKSFYKLANNPLLRDIDEDVIAVAQGDFRIKAKREADPSNEKDVEEFYNLSLSLQKKYNDLKEKYKNDPPARLFHGNRPENIEKVKNSGFMNPQQYSRSGHQELGVGAPSFTKDIGLGGSAPTFGGKEAQNYVYTEMPYADYLFKRINMPAKEYDLKDLNIVAQTINGSPNVVRPLSLPRAAFNETEDAIVEADKLKLNGSSSEMKLKMAEEVLTTPTRKDGKGLLESTVARNQKIKEDRELLRGYNKIVSDGNTPIKERRKTAYLTYNIIKSLTNEMLGSAESVSTKKGLGHSYQSNLVSFSDQISASKIGDVITVLKDMGAVQKAKALEDVRVKLKELSSASSQQGKAMSDKFIIKPLNTAREATRKLARGGFITKR
ncbi:hypothetical protein UFOVP662_45 [uncultured Caudovirales phage]|uniref:Large polyvalent protein associated domain-containing protein n=1 Tax=uncultured Caudovirales phage TaxID=2100421 RepID=A0A6J5N986_9CAUD|nr:hypothetical protein UFOVP662_45 [uncultured Caudovirales phage]CAB4181505.1 hypothetical protein UFOVP1067_45 [uncultured Caudovirales phage]